MDRIFVAIIISALLLLLGVPGLILVRQAEKCITPGRPTWKNRNSAKRSLSKGDRNDRLEPNGSHLPRHHRFSTAASPWRGRAGWRRWWPDFDGLHSRKHNEEVQFYAFDILVADGEDIRKRP